MKIKMLYKGCYRTETVRGRFGQIKKKPGYWDSKYGCAVYVAAGWHSEIRDSSGELQRYAGVWPTLKDAVEEVEHILTKD